jgi:hypothetical protein
VGTVNTQGVTCHICGDDASARPGWCRGCWTDALTLCDFLRLPTDTIPGRRFVSKVDMGGPMPEEEALGACWLWTGATNQDGYGIFRLGPDKLVRAHVYAYTLATGGPVPDGQEVDHLCHDWRTCTLTDTCPHRRCCNPRHLAAVSGAVNTARSGNPTAINALKTHCPYSHPLVGPGADVYVHRDGRIECAVCKRTRGRGKVAARVYPVTADQAAELAAELAQPRPVKARRRVGRDQLTLPGTDRRGG